MSFSGPARFRGFNLAAGAWEPAWLAPWKCNVVRMGLRLGNQNDINEMMWCLEHWEQAGLGIKLIPVVWIEKPPPLLDDPVFYDSAHYHALTQVWESLARQLKDHPQIAAFDLLNEPSHRKIVGRWTTWNPMAGWLVNSIHKIDKKRKIIIEPLHGDIRELSKLKLQGANCIYSPHMYAPTIYTHQGIRTHGSNKPVKYDSIKRRVVSSLRAIGRWQEKKKAITGTKPKIFIGEFSAVRWADGVERYLKTCVDYFEMSKWSWCYHTLWPEFANKEPPIPEQPWDLNCVGSERAKAVILEGMSKNE